MKAMPVHFRVLLNKINPPDPRRRRARELVGDLRDWLQEQDFETVDPHTRLIGSYARFTAVLWIKDVDALALLPAAALDRTPNAVLLDLRRVLDGYPEAVVSAVGQRRSIRIDFEAHDLSLDVVPAVAPDGLDEPLLVPDRPKKLWIPSDPLGYMRRVTALNKTYGGRLVPLVKLVKAWRDAQMKIRRPKSYILEVMVVKAVEGEKVVLEGESWPSVLAQLFGHWAAKYRELMDSGEGVPRIYDPQLGNLISGGWTRPEFETFMRRVREADAAAARALAAETEEDAGREWERIFLELWPSDDEVERAAREEAARHVPGRTQVARVGWVTGPAVTRTLPSQPTRFHGGKR